MRVEVQAMHLPTDVEEIKKLVPPEILQKYQGKGVLQAYILAQEGMSQPKVLGQGGQSLRWPKRVIEKLKEKIKSGTKFFVDHGIDNSHEGRTAIGEAITSAVKDIRGKLSTVVIGHFPDKEKVQNLDICSLETNVETLGEQDDIVNDVDDISGIALGSSLTTSPAFPGAKRLATIQCFDENQHINNPDGEKSNPGEGDEKMNFEDVKKAIRDMNIFPWQIFSEEDMRKDKVFGKILDERDKLSEEKKSLIEDLEKTKKESETAIKESQKSSARTRLKETLPEGLTEKQTKYIVDNFDPEKIEDLSEEGIKQYVDEAQKDYTKLAKMFGVVEGGGESKNENESSNGSQTEPIENDPIAVAMKELTSK